MTLQENLEAFADEIAAKCKALNTIINGNESNLVDLNTTAKSNLVAAINELKSQLQSVSATIATLESLPSGGDEGQVLTKASDDDYDVVWSTVGNETLVWNAPTSSTLWVISHNLGRFPAVTVVDSSGRKYHGSVQYIDINTLTVSFNYATGGKAYLV